MTDTLFPVEIGAGNALASTDLADSLLTVGSMGNDGNVSYLKFTKGGVWEFGREGDSIEKDELLAVNPASFVAGWQGWNNGAPVNGPVLPVGQMASLPAESELPAIPPGEMNGWQSLFGVNFKAMEDGTDLQYHATSHGGKKFVQNLMKAVALGMKDHLDAPVALVKLSSDNYKHTSFGKIFTPEFAIVGWANAEGKEVKKLAA